MSGEYSRLKELLLSKVIDFGQFKENTQWMNPQIVDLIALIKRFDAQILELIAETRVLRKTSENPLSLIFRWLVITSKHPKNFKILVDNELRHLKKELGI